MWTLSVYIFFCTKSVHLTTLVKARKIKNHKNSFFQKPGNKTSYLILQNAALKRGSITYKHNFPQLKAPIQRNPSDLASTRAQASI